MGANHSNSQSTKRSSSPNSLGSTPEKEKTTTKITPEQLISSANELIETSRRVVKEINEAQYSTYKVLDFQSRISKQHSVAEDLRYFLQILENDQIDIQQECDHHQFCNKKSVIQSGQEMIAMRYNEKAVRLTQVETLLNLVNQARSSFTNCQNLIVKCSQLIEYIEIIEQREKKIIKQKGLKKQLDQAQINLNDTSMILEQYLMHKLQVSSSHELDHSQFKLQKMQNALYTEIAKYQREQRDDDIHQEIPFELY